MWRREKRSISNGTVGRQVGEEGHLPIFSKLPNSGSSTVPFEKYFLSNAPTEAKVQTLVRVAFRRWHVEHAIRVSKSELGFTHYEGRNYTALMRHQTLCLLMLTFVAEHTQRLRGEKSRSDHGAGVQCLEPVVRGVAGGAAGDESPPAAVTGSSMANVRVLQPDSQTGVVEEPGEQLAVE